MTAGGTRRVAWWTTVIALIVAIVATLGVGLWQAADGREVELNGDTAARQEVLDTAKSTTTTMLSYTPENVETELRESLPLLTGEFRKSYEDLITDVVIPGAREKNITAVAQVPAAAVESLSSDRAAVLLFVNQTVTTGTDAPQDTASSVKVGLQKLNGKWLIDRFDPV